MSPHTTTISVTMKNRWSAQNGAPPTTVSRSQMRKSRLSGLRAIDSATIAMISPARSRERKFKEGSMKMCYGICALLVSSQRSGNRLGFEHLLDRLSVDAAHVVDLRG